MKKDVKLLLENGQFDIVIEDGDFANEDGFDTAVWVSLFSDARATVSQVLTPEKRRGWLGNLVSEKPERQLGGYLWLAEQRRLTQDTVNEIVDYARKALNYMIEDGLVLKIDVTGEIIPRTGIELLIVITSLDGLTTNHVVHMWQITGN